jgi:hypothetical protein
LRGVRESRDFHRQNFQIFNGVAPLSVFLFTAQAQVLSGDLGEIRIASSENAPVALLSFGAVHLRRARLRRSFFARDRGQTLSAGVASYGLVPQDTHRDKCFKVAPGRFSIAQRQTDCKDHSGRYPTRQAGVARVLSSSFGFAFAVGRTSPSVYAIRKLRKKLSTSAASIEGVP